MKRREPGTFASAITRIKAAVGEDQCSEAVDRSASTVRKWADPDHPSLPNLDQVLMLDLQYSRAGFGQPLILNAYTGRLAEKIAEFPHERQDLLLAALSVQAAVGELSQAIRAAMSPDSPGGTNIKPSERNLILTVLERLSDAVAIVEIALDDADSPRQDETGS